MSLEIKNLHPLEIKVLLNVHQGEEIHNGVLISRLQFNVGQCNQAFSWLAAKNLVRDIRRIEKRSYEITDLGKRYQREGTPEERILSFVNEQGPASIPELSAALDLENKDAGSAFGNLSKEKVLIMDADKKVAALGETPSDRMKTVRTLLDRAAEEGGTLAEEDLSEEEKTAIAAISKKRGAGGTEFKVVEGEEVVYSLTDEGMEARDSLKKAGITGEEAGALTSEMLAKGTWRNVQFRAYNVNTPANRTLLGRKNPYTEFLESVKDKLVSLGFEEFDGPLVETEFWNSDALFMPQFHSARDIHDVYQIKEPAYAKAIEQPYLDQIAAAHENGWKTGSRGWQYDFDRDFTRRLILRSQGTVLSAKQLPKAAVPGKYFGIVRCFRYDQVDATHLSDFYQTEGIVLGEDVNLRTLLGLLKMFAEEVAGAEEVMYVPGYFPFTEPSVEVHIKHPELGWFELGGSGIFRPEVTEPLGVHVPVLAWGLGIDRMALMSLGLNDLRELFSPDIETIRLRRREA
jgi:phenylalanyl-tRNA synthetase alpha chain